MAARRTAAPTPDRGRTAEKQARRPRTRVALTARVALVTVLAGAAVPGCRPASHPTASDIPAPLAGLPITTATIAGRELDVVVANTPETRARGLMHVADLGPLDGMVFEHGGTVTTSYWMKDVPITLDIAFIAEDGSVVSVRTMAICTADPCPRYPSNGPFRWALETPEGGLRDVQAGDRFELRPVP